MVKGYKTLLRIFVFLTLSLFLLCSFPNLDTASASKGNAGHIVINEVAFNTTDPNARWFEIYNPTTKAINLSGWEYYHSCIYCPFHFPAITIYPGDYIVFTTSISNFTSYWGVDHIRVYDRGVPEFPSEGVIQIWDKENGVDSMVSSSSEIDLTYCLNHSWARYRGGYDTDNFTNDFYDEPHPTPGYENHRGKGDYLNKPFAPLNLNVSLIDSEVKLTWNPPVDGNSTITGYKIYRGTSNDSLEVMATVNGSVTEYLDDNVTAGEKYYYVVSSVNLTGESDLSEVVSIEIPKEKEPAPSIGLAGIIGVIGIVMYIRYRRRK